VNLGSRQSGQALRCTAPYPTRAPPSSTAGLPRRFEFDEKILIRTVNLSRIRTNGSIPASMFTFRVPSGVRVVE